MYHVIILLCLAACRAQFIDELQSFERECLGENLYTCVDGGCVPHERYCDGTPDCADGSDENFCPDHPPDAHLCNVTHQFLCRDGHACIPSTWVCNGAPDCTDASDEANCTELPYTNSTASKCKGFTCGDGKCISSLWACDGHYNCEDRSDENIDTCKHSLNAHRVIDGHACQEFPIIEPRRYKCLDLSFCLTGDKMCDNVIDCRDGSDEGPFCDTWHTMCNNTICPRNITDCTPDRTGPLCSCIHYPTARWFNHTTQLCQDVDECLQEIPVCSHKCQNFNGHFRCHCDKGYVADSFRFLCFADGPEAMLFFSTETDIRYIKLKTMQEVTVTTGIKRTHGVSYDGRYLYWVEKAQGHQAIARAHLENPEETKETLVSVGLRDPGDIAVDWLGGNIYFSDQERGVIHVCKTDGSVCAHVNTNATRPRFVTLDVKNGTMYWADMLNHRHVIMRSRMDGSQPELMLDDMENFATGLALDVPNGRLYFVDRAIKAIRVDTKQVYDGSQPVLMLDDMENFATALAFDVPNGTLYFVDRAIKVIRVDTKQVYSLFEERLYHPSAIAVFENTVYWSDWTSDTIQATDKLYSSKEKSNLLAKLHTPVYGMHIYHPVLMNRESNPCAGHNCSHLCLLTSNTTYTCACPVGMLLNGSVCYNEANYRSQYLVVGAGASFTRFQYDALGNPETHATTFDIGRVQAMAYDSRRDILFVYDGMRKEINTIGMTDFSLGITHVFVYSGLENVVDMDYDYMTDNLYVLDAGRRFLEVFSVKDGKRALVHRFPDQEMPLSFCIVQYSGKLLVAVVESEQNNEIHIDSIGLDGDNREHQHLIMNLKGPQVSLRNLRDSDLVAISDENYSIDFIHLKPQGFRRSTRKVMPTEVTSLAVTLPFVFWTDRKTPRVFWEEYNTVSFAPRRMELSIFPNDTHLHIQATSQAPNNTTIASHPCSQNPCSHICVQSQSDVNQTPISLTHVDASKYSYKCLCPPGLMVEGGNCSKLAVCGQDELHCYESNVCIQRVKKCDGAKDCLHGEDEKDCGVTTQRPSTCLPTQIECNGTCIYSTEICPKEITEVVTPPFSCEFEQFQCVTDRLCLDREQVCDQHPDCPDGSDEGSLCHTLRCLETEFMCTSGNCILSSFRCDGDADCSDGSDEEDCANRSCNVGSYQCRSGQCVDLHRRCDRQPDCFDGSDEEHCEEHVSDTCRSGQCVDLHRRCDRQPDCFDGSDEEHCEEHVSDTVTLLQYKRTANVQSVHSLPVPQRTMREPAPPLCPTWCNNVVDCPGGTDEHGCTSFCTAHGLFECKQEMICLSMRRVCNQNKDCADGSDETPEACEKVNRTSGVLLPPPYPAAECHHGFLCRTGQCIEWREVCDQTPDCFDNSDENGQCFTACENVTCSHHCQPTPLGPQCTCDPGFELQPDLHTCSDTDECNKDPCSQHCMNFPGSFLCSCRHGYTLRSDRRTCKANIGSPKTILFASGPSVRSISDIGLGRVEYEDSTLGIIADVDVNVARNTFYVTSPETGKLIEVSPPKPGIPLNDTDLNVITNIGKPTKVAVEWVTGNVYFVDNSAVPSIKVCNFQKKRCAVIKKLHTGTTVTSLAVSPETHHLYYCVDHLSRPASGPLTRLDLNGLNQINPEIADECIGLAVDGPVLYMAGGMDLWSLDPEQFRGKKSIPNWPMLHPHDIITFEDHVYVLGDHRIYQCLTFGPKTCQPYIFRLPDAQAFVMMHPSIQRDLVNACDGYTCDNVCVLGQHGPLCVCADGRISGDGKCALSAKSDVPLFNGTPAQELQRGHQVSVTLISITVFLFAMYLAIFVYYHCVYRPRKDAVTLPVRFQNRTSFSESPAQTPIVELPSASGSGHEFVNPLQFVRNIWQRSFGRGGRPVGTAGLSFDIPKPKEDLSDTESDIDSRDEKTLIK